MDDAVFIVPSDSREESVLRIGSAAHHVVTHERYGRPSYDATETLALLVGDAARFGLPSWSGDAIVAMLRGDGYAAPEGGESVAQELYDSAVRIVGIARDNGYGVELTPRMEVRR